MLTYIYDNMLYQPQICVLRAMESNCVPKSTIYDSTELWNVIPQSEKLQKRCRNHHLKGETLRNGGMSAWKQYKTQKKMYDKLWLAQVVFFSTFD